MDATAALMTPREILNDLLSYCYSSQSVANSRINANIDDENIKRHNIGAGSAFESVANYILQLKRKLNEKLL